MCTWDAWHTFPFIDRQTRYIRKVGLHMGCRGRGAKGTDGVKAPFADALDHSISKAIQRVWLGKFADRVCQIKGKVSILIASSEGRGKLAFGLGQPLVDILSPLHISVVIARSKTTDTEMKEEMAIWVHEP